jgi:hypothetical protein
MVISITVDERSWEKLGDEILMLADDKKDKFHLLNIFGIFGI